MGQSKDNQQKNVYVCQMAKENGFDSGTFRSYCRKVSAGLEAVVMECGCEPCQPGQSHRLDGKDYYLLYYVSSGTGQLSFSGKKLELFKGDLFALFPGETAALCADREKPWVLHWVGFSGCRASNLLHKTVLQRDRILQGVGETKLPLYIRRIHEVAVNDEDEEILECRLVSELYSFLGEALSECRLLYDKGALGERDIAKRAVEAIHARYSDGLCVSQLAKEIHVSRSYLYEVFEAETGVSPKEYLDSLRLSKACGLLHIHEEYSDEKVAAMVGFSEPRNFIKKFKERFHMTPIEYRKSTKATPSENMIDRKVDYTESIEFNFPHDGNKTVYPTTLKEQIEALKKDPVLAHFAECRAAAKRDRHTPLYHFSNPNGGLNDPNGPCFWQGRWHLFYQHIMPLAEGDRTIYWGHAVSSDLIHWVDLPDAIYPNPEKECWSGSTCVEDNKVTALWYGFRGHGGLLCATSDDPLLLNWNKIYPDPVIPGQVGQCGDKPYDVYDPCIWRQGEYYYALAGCHMPNPVTGHWMRVEYLFRSKDCLDWEYRHPFVKEDWFSEINDDGACPYFVPLGDKHLLMHFCHARGPEYLVGKYDTENECFIPAFGKRFNLYKCSGLHAPALVSDGEGGAYMFCVIPGGHMSLPYHLTLGGNGDELHVSLPEGLKSLRKNHIHKENIDMPANQEVVIDGVGGDCLEIVARFDSAFVSVIEMKVLRSPDDEEYTKITFYRNRGAQINWDNPLSILALDCEHTSLNPPTDHSLLYVSAPDTEEFRIEPDEDLELHIFLDKSLIDVFANDRTCIGKRVYPSREDSLGISVTAIGADSKLISLDVWEMDAIDQSSLEGLRAD